MSETESSQAEAAAAAAALLERAKQWADGDPDPVSRAELAALIEARDDAELRERMLSELAFGTAGLRGVVGAGSARMNLAVVLRVTRALVEQLSSDPPERALSVVLGCDARLDSRRFADAAARVLLAAGIRVLRFIPPVPTPFVAYAVCALAASAGIMITASHNPPEYNGYKLYWHDGIQVTSPIDAAIAARMAALGPATEIPLGDLADQEAISDSLVDRYFAEIQSEVPHVAGDRSLPIVYTPLHGVGASAVERLFRQAGYLNFQTVPEQREPDGHFPTVPFPNPEEPGALDLALALAQASKAGLLIANDPDVDRLAICVPRASGGWVALSGNQIGLLLADFALSHSDAGTRPLVLSSVVSSPMLESIAAAHGARCERVLTGFKWVWTAALALQNQYLRYCFGYEEALGYSFGRTVRDKDGISAALAFAELAVEASSRGQSVLDRLHVLYREHGLWVSVQHNVVLMGSLGAARIESAMHSLASAPPRALGARTVTTVRDLRVPEPNAPIWRGPTLLVELTLSGGGRLFARPSGTEPKLKIYLDLLATVSRDQSLASAEDDARAEAELIARALVSTLGLDAE